MAEIRGIDISSWQSGIDWTKLAKEVDFVIIRSGYGNSENQIDSKFKSHIESAINAGIKNIGIYHFSYATSEKDAKQEAKVCLSIINKYKSKINMPIAFDWEYDSKAYCDRMGVKVSKAIVTKFGQAFCREIEKNGFNSMLYTNPDYASRYFDLSKFKYLWIAQYASECSIKSADLWQYTSDGSLPGYSGNLDMNICYNKNIFTSKAEEKIMGYAVKSLLRVAMNLQIIDRVKLADDAVIGTGTKKCIKQVQKLLKLKQTGEPDEKTVKGLGKLVEEKMMTMQGVVAIQKEIAEQ